MMKICNMLYNMVNKSNSNVKDVAPLPVCGQNINTFVVVYDLNEVIF